MSYPEKGASYQGNGRNVLRMACGGVGRADGGATQRVVFNPTPLGPEQRFERPGRDTSEVDFGPDDLWRLNDKTGWRRDAIA